MPFGFFHGFGGVFVLVVYFMLFLLSALTIMGKRYLATQRARSDQVPVNSLLA